jgi:hypothetical protein
VLGFKVRKILASNQIDALAAWAKTTRACLEGMGGLIPPKCTDPVAASSMEEFLSKASIARQATPTVAFQIWFGAEWMESQEGFFGIWDLRVLPEICLTSSEQLWAKHRSMRLDFVASSWTDGVWDLASEPSTGRIVGDLGVWYLTERVALGGGAWRADNSAEMASLCSDLRCVPGFERLARPVTLPGSLREAQGFAENCDARIHAVLGQHWMNGLIALVGATVPCWVQTPKTSWVHRVFPRKEGRAYGTPADLNHLRSDD